MSERFVNKRAIVTGASRGIGRTIAEALATSGAEVWNLDLNNADIKGVKTIQVDLRDIKSVKTVLDSIGSVDYLVNNAAISLPLIPFVDFSKTDLDALIDTDLKAPFQLSQIVVRSMIEKNNGGSIVHIGSSIGLRPKDGLSAYCIAKAGIAMLTKVMALELGVHKIRVNSICPTAVHTEMGKIYLDDPEFYIPFIARHPLGELPETKDVANAVLFLLSDEASMITGTSLPVDAGTLVS